MSEITTQIREWFAQRIPSDWFQGELELEADDNEILVVGELLKPEAGKDTPASDAELQSIRRFREETREKRIEIASAAEHLFNRKVSWGATCGSTTKMFTGLGVPVMTRLRLRERAVLDTLVGAGVARSRSEALAWCVSIVSEKQKDWIDELKDAAKKVEEVRRRGPRKVSLA